MITDAPTRLQLTGRDLLDTEGMTAVKWQLNSAYRKEMEEKGSGARANQEEISRICVHRIKFLCEGDATVHELRR